MLKYDNAENIPNIVYTDGRGRVRSITYPDMLAEQFAYDPMGNLTNHVDRAGRVTRFEYAPAGRLTAAMRQFGSGWVTNSMAYDQQFNTLRIRDALGRNVESYQLDDQDRAVAVTNVEQQVMSVQYGLGGIVHSITRFDGTTVSNAYDGQARLIQQILPGQTNTFSYTAGGNLKTVANETGTVSNTYDNANRLTAVASVYSVYSVVNNYSLDGIGNATNVLVSVDGTLTFANTYTFDAAERLTNLVADSGSFAWSYNPYNGMVSSMAHAESGIGTAYGFDITDRLTNITWNGTTTGMGFSMQYSSADMITNVVYADGQKRVYIYDSLDRLTGEKHFDASKNITHNAAYEYDLAGNRTRAVINGATNTYSLGSGNRLASWTGGSYGHDVAGCVTQITDAAGIRSLAWNSQYQLTAVATNGTIAESYGYDPLGRRAWTSDGAVTNWHIYDGVHCVADVDDSGAVIRSYTWGTGVDNLLAITVHDSGGANTYRAITDHIGTVHALADESGDIVESYRFDAWGNLLAVFDSTGQSIPSSVVGNRYLFQGREYSWATDLYNFRARWYDPVSGRWLSKDPIGISGGLDQYVAFGNNPVNFKDPEGLAEIAFPFVKPLGEGKDMISAAEATRLGALITHDTPRTKTFTVTGHGLYLGNEDDPEHVSVAMGNPKSPVDAKELAEMIFKHKAYEPGMDVYLDGCNTGNRTSEYPVPFAKSVSDALYELTQSSSKRSRVMGTPGPVNYLPFNGGLKPSAYVRFYDRRLTYIVF